MNMKLSEDVSNTIVNAVANGMAIGTVRSQVSVVGVCATTQETSVNDLNSRVNSMVYDEVTKATNMFLAVLEVSVQIEEVK